MIAEYKQSNNLNEIKLDVSTDAQYLDVLEFVQSELKLIGITCHEVHTRTDRHDSQIASFSSVWLGTLTKDTPTLESELSQHSTLTDVSTNLRTDIVRKPRFLAKQSIRGPRQLTRFSN